MGMESDNHGSAETCHVLTAPNKKARRSRDRLISLPITNYQLPTYALMIPFRIAYRTNSERECRFNLCMIFSR